MLGRNLRSREASIYEQTPDFFELREFRLVAVWNEINEITGVRTASGLVDHWIYRAGQEERIGLIRLFDLQDIGSGSPLFDLRILERYRGQGVGNKAVAWLTRFAFETWPELNRIEGTTRVDNMAMRAIFQKCGYVKEGHYRKTWPAIDGQKVDTVQYSILREDWISGTPTLVTWND